MGLTIIVFVITMLVIILLIKKTKNADFLYLIFVPFFIMILIIIFTFAESVGKGYFEVERHLVVENLYEGKYLFKKDVDGGFSVLEKIDNGLVYKKIVNVDKENSYNEGNLWLVVYKTQTPKSDFFRFGIKGFRNTAYVFERKE